MTASGPAVPTAGRRWLVRGIFALAAVLSVVAIFSVWANRQLLNTTSWADTNTKLLQNDAIRGQIAGFVTDELFSSVDIAGQLQSGLPSRLQPLAAPASAALRDLVEKGTNKALMRPKVQNLWRAANVVTHKQLVNLIEDRGRAIRLPGGGAVILDLRPLVGAAAERAGLPASATAALPADLARIRILKADQLTSLQKIAKALKSLAVVLPILAVLLLMLAVWLSAGRRREALLWAGLLLVAAGLLVLIVRSLAGGQVVDAVAADAGVRPAANAAWSIATSMLAEIAGAVIFMGVPLILAALLAGPSRVARDLRRRIAPVLADRPELAYGAVAVALMLLLWWGPIPATRRIGWVLLFTFLAFFGMAMLRRQTAAEGAEARSA